MTSYDQGAVVLIPFPFTDFSTLKQRPAVVLSSTEFNRTHQDVIVAAITSHLPEVAGFGDYLLKTDEQHAAGLPKPSAVKLGKLVTLDQRLIRKKLGALPPQTLSRLLPQFLDNFRPADRQR